jgi:hypothetical protein
MPAYSFIDVVATISGPGGTFSLCEGTSEEGITIEPTGDKNVMTKGADDSTMHSLRADTSATITVTKLKTSAVNAQLQQMFNVQSQSSATWGKNTISVKHVALGDDITCSEVAFASNPATNYAVEGGTVVWTFHAGKVKKVLGTGGLGRG